VTELRVKILSYNVGGHGARWSRSYLDRIARTIVEAGADVVGLQEVHRGTRQSRLEDQAEALGRLTGLSVRFGKSFALGEGEFGNAVLTRGELRSSEIHVLPGPGEPRTLLHCCIALAGGEIDFFVTHLAAWSRWGRAARSVQIQGLVERLRQQHRQHLQRRPFVLVGVAPHAHEVPGADLAGLGEPVLHQAVANQASVDEDVNGIAVEFLNLRL